MASSLSVQHVDVGRDWEERTGVWKVETFPFFMSWLSSFPFCFGTRNRTQGLICARLDLPLSCSQPYLVDL